MSSKIKKITALAVSLLLVFALALAIILPSLSKEEQSEQKSITVFSWEDYMYFSWFDGDVGLLDEFTEETGIAVNYVTFATSEEMYNELMKDPSACDLLCPSEYMILKMKDEGLIKEFTMPTTYKDNVSPYIKSEFERLGLSNGDKTYACGYMWGTMGYLYNAEKYDESDFSTWKSVFEIESLNGKSTIKDSLRDTYIMAVAIVYEEQLYELKGWFNDGIDGQGNPYGKEEYINDLTRIFNLRDQETIDKVEDVLLEIKPKLYGFEVDAGKEDLLSGKIDVNFCWSGDAVYSISEGEDAGKDLGYAVPEEGTNVWFDGFVMTNNADEESSIKFIDFLSRPVNAAKNMEYIGYTSVISGNEQFTITYPEEDEDGEFIYENGELLTYDVQYEGIYDWMVQTFELETTMTDGYEMVDLNYFFPNDGNDYTVWSSESGKRFYAQYPPEDVIERAVVMANFSSKDLMLLNEMWNRVKLLTFDGVAMAIIVTLLIAVVVTVILLKNKEKIFQKKVPDAKKKIRRKGCKVIKIEEL